MMLASNIWWDLGTITYEKWRKIMSNERDIALSKRIYDIIIRFFLICWLISSTKSIQTGCRCLRARTAKITCQVQGRDSHVTSHQGLNDVNMVTSCKIPEGASPSRVEPQVESQPSWRQWSEHKSVDTWQRKSKIDKRICICTRDANLQE